MERRLVSLLIIVLNLLTMVSNLLIGYFLMIVYAFAFTDQQDFIVIFSLATFIGIEVLKWTAFNKIFKEKKSKWIIFYLIYTGLYFILAGLVASASLLFFLIPISYSFAIYLMKSR